MVYKKFIKRGGKLYGPYVYRSRRENGVVVTEYQGKSFLNRKKIAAFFITPILVLLLAFFFFSIFSDSNLTGRVNLQFSEDSLSPDIRNGLLQLSIQEGELIPADTIVVVQQSEREQTFQLSDLVGEDYILGTFYADGVDLEGEGYGYGIIGEKVSYPEVQFILDLTPIVEEVIDESEEIIGTSGTSTDTTTETSEVGGETSTVNEEIVGTSTEETSTEEAPNEETTEINEDVELIVETPSDETSEATIEETPETSEEKNKVEKETKEEKAVEKEEAKESKKETDTNSESVTSEIPTEVSLTGGIIKTIVGLFVVDSTWVEGSVYGNENYTLDLSLSARVSLRPGSVVVNGSVVDDSFVKVTQQGTRVTVTTNYVYREEGFGSDYVTDEGEILDISLSEFELDFLEPFTVSVMYQETVLAEISSESLTSQNETFIELNETINKNLSDGEFADSLELNDEERDFLIKTTGASKLVTEKSQVENERLVLKHSLGKYWVQYTYDYDENASNFDVLEKKIDSDKKFWMKQLAIQLMLTKQFEPKRVDRFLTSVDIGGSNISFETNESNGNVSIETNENLTIGNFSVGKSVENASNSNASLPDLIEENLTESNITV